MSITFRKLSNDLNLYVEIYASGNPSLTTTTHNWTSLFFTYTIQYIILALTALPSIFAFTEVEHHLFDLPCKTIRPR